MPGCFDVRANEEEALCHVFASLVAECSGASCTCVRMRVDIARSDVLSACSRCRVLHPGTVVPLQCSSALVRWFAQPTRLRVHSPGLPTQRNNPSHRKATSTSECTASSSLHCTSSSISWRSRGKSDWGQRECQKSDAWIFPPPRSGSQRIHS